jgi:hypothetical protein
VNWAGIAAPAANAELVTRRVAAGPVDVPVGAVPEAGPGPGAAPPQPASNTTASMAPHATRPVIGT